MVRRFYRLRLLPPPRVSCCALGLCLSFPPPGFFLWSLAILAIQALEQETSENYGSDGVLLPLKDKCITAKSGGYDYRVCPFKDAHQEQGKTKVSA